MEDFERLLSRPGGLERNAAAQVIAALSAIDAANDRPAGRAALAALARRPRAVIRLDDTARRVQWGNGISARLSAGAASPLGVALASSHGDGRIRERAVREILARPSPELVPFLVVRTCDWVHEVRSVARAGLAVLLHDDPARHLPAALGVGLRVESWSRGTFVRNQLLAAAVDPRARLGTLLDSPDVLVRRFAFSAGTWRPDDVVRLAEHDPDVRLRSSAAEAAAREAVWANRVALLRRLAASPRTEVRVQALTGLARLGHDADVLAFLDDRSSLVRAVARAAAARLGVDPLRHYRSRVTSGAVDGVAEVGGPADAAYLVELLAHPTAVIRARAVRALRLLDQVPDDRVLPLLRDPSSAVVREAAFAVRDVPRELPWELVADERVAVRRAGYALARRQGAEGRLRAALLATADPAPGLVLHGFAAAGRVARELTRGEASPRWSAAGAVGLRVLLERAAPLLNDDTARVLRRHIG